MFKVPEQYRVRAGVMGTNKSAGNNGAFLLYNPDLFVIASDGGGWEHVSVSTVSRTPTWEEMCLVKDLFWGEEDCVVQFHPPKDVYVNNHPYCLHLWRKIGTEYETPPTCFVGVK